MVPCPALAPTAHLARCCLGADEPEVWGQMGDSELPGGTVPKGCGWNRSRGCLQEAAEPRSGSRGPWSSPGVGGLVWQGGGGGEESCVPRPGVSLLRGASSEPGASEPSLI